MRRVSPDAETMPLIDMFRALELLAIAVRQQADEDIEHPVAPSRKPGNSSCLGTACDGPHCLVGHALSSEQLGEESLEALRCGHSVRKLYTQGRLSVRLTLGALVVLDTAQRSEERGLRWSEALDHATAAAARFLDLIPDSFFIAAISDQIAAGNASSIPPGLRSSGQNG